MNNAIEVLASHNERNLQAALARRAADRGRLEDTYSIGVLWNLDAATLNQDVEAGDTDPTPVSGDAHLRSRADLLVRTEDMNKAWAQARMEASATDHFADRRRDEARARYRTAVAAALVEADRTV